jgi:dolichol-phosphate mannosyltransferase
LRAQTCAANAGGNKAESCGKSASEAPLPLSAGPDSVQRAEARAYWNARAREARVATENAALHAGTVTRDAHVVGLRDQLELAHLARIWKLHPEMRVLDLAGGAGRFALRVAPLVKHVTLVDLAEEQLAVARDAARAAGVSNLTTVCASITEVELTGSFDLILLFGILVYLSDDEVTRLAARCRAWLSPGGKLILREPVSTTGAEILQTTTDLGLSYRARFRPREALPLLFGAELALVYQRATCAHPFPFFLRGTEGAAEVTRAGAAQALIARIAPGYVRLDPWLLALESRLRARPLLKHLLAPVPVLQDYYVFEAKEAVCVDLSVVVIAFNEAACLASVAEELRHHLACAGLQFEIVLVDDGSKDGTLAIMEKLRRADPRFRVVPLSPNRGIGGALRAGFDAARGRHVTWIPADGQIPPDAVTTLFARRNEAPMLTTVYRSRADAWYRKLISQSLNTLIRVRTGQVAKSGGNYLFSRAAWEAHGPRDDDTMMLSTSFRHNLRAAGETLVEVEIDCRARVAGSSKVLNPKAILRTLGALLKAG